MNKRYNLRSGKRARDESNASYLSLLPIDVIGNFLSYLDLDACREACLPILRRDADGGRGVAHYPATRSSRLTNPLRNVFCGTFSSIQVCEGREIEFDPDEKLIRIGKSASKEHFTNIIMHFGAHIDTICLSVHHSLPKRFLNRSFMEYGLSALKKLNIMLPSKAESIIDNIAEVLKKAGPALESLTISGKRERARVVFGLASGILNCRNLKFVAFHGTITSQLVGAPGLWDVIGANVEDIFLGYELDAVYNWSRVFSKIRDSVPKLKDIHFGLSLPRSIDHDEYLDFLGHYGKNLQHAPFGSLGAKELGKLAKIAPNLLGEWTVFDVGDVDRLIAVADVLDYCSIDFHEVRNLTVLSDVFANCKRLNTLDVYPSLDENVPYGKLTFHHCMMELKHLSLVSCCNIEELCELVLSTPSLTKIDVKFVDNITEKKVPRFRTLIQALPRLVHLRLADSEKRMKTYQEEEFMDSILSDTYPSATVFVELCATFANCNRLLSLQFVIGAPLPSAETFQTACIPYRRHGTYVSLSEGNMRYIQYANGCFFLADEDDLEE